MEPDHLGHLLRPETNLFKLGATPANAKREKFVSILKNTRLANLGTLVNSNMLDPLRSPFVMTVDMIVSEATFLGKPLPGMATALTEDQPPS